jgi:membrane-bound lytic murein transglycosylase D
LVPVANAEQLQLGLAGLADSERLRWLRHKIAAGESLGAIAKQYGVTIGVLKQANQLNGNLIRAGKHLLIPRVEALPQRLAASCRGTSVSHRVTRGDSLWDISRRYGVTVNHLKRCNPGLSVNNLALGSRITIRDPLALAKALVPPSKRRVDQVINYRVKRGDSLAAISSRFGVSVKQLVAWNQINPNNYLQPGDKLIVRLNLLDQG